MSVVCNKYVRILNQNVRDNYKSFVWISIYIQNIHDPVLWKVVKALILQNPRVKRDKSKNSF